MDSSKWYTPLREWPTRVESQHIHDQKERIYLLAACIRGTPAIIIYSENIGEFWKNAVISCTGSQSKKWETKRRGISWTRVGVEKMSTWDLLGPCYYNAHTYMYLKANGLLYTGDKTCAVARDVFLMCELEESRKHPLILHSESGQRRRRRKCAWKRTLILFFSVPVFFYLWYVFSLLCVPHFEKNE